MNIPIGIIGFGHMGQAIARSLVGAGFKKIFASDSDIKKISGKKIIPISKNKELAKKSKIIILAVRPADMRSVLLEIKELLFKNHILISIAAGVPLKFFKKYAPAKAKIVRVMPNLPAQIGQGISVWKPLNLNAKEKNLVKKILNSFGKEIEVQKEDLINAATAVSGSGPAYVFAFLDTLQKSALHFGFPEKHARLLALQLVFGSVNFAEASKEKFEVLAKQVQTKGGTTEAAFKILNEERWNKVLQQAIKKAYERSAELIKIS